MTDLHTRIAELAAKATPQDIWENQLNTLSRPITPEEISVNFELIATLRSAVPEILAALRIAERVMDEDWLEETVSDTLDMDWHPRDAARAIIAALKEPT